jgi:hypothetical protein
MFLPPFRQHLPPVGGFRRVRRWLGQQDSETVEPVATSERLLADSRPVTERRSGGSRRCLVTTAPQPVTRRVPVLPGRGGHTVSRTVAGEGGWAPPDHRLTETASGARPRDRGPDGLRLHPRWPPPPQVPANYPNRDVEADSIRCNRTVAGGASGSLPGRRLDGGGIQGDDLERVDHAAAGTGLLSARPSAVVTVVVVVPLTWLAYRRRRMMVSHHQPTGPPTRHPGEHVPQHQVRVCSDVRRETTVRR